MNPLLTTLGALAIGAGTMYYRDPDSGRRRRALLQDRVDKVGHEVQEYVDVRRKRASDRAHGLLASARSALRRTPPGDEQLNGRIRARLGRLVSHPHAIRSEVSAGHVTLRGDILAGELKRLMGEIWAMNGVTGVDNRLVAHEAPGNVPSLQGEPRTPRALRSGTEMVRSAAPALAVGVGAAALLGATRGHEVLRAGGVLALATGLLMMLGSRSAARQTQSRAGEHAGRPAEAGTEPAAVEEVAAAAGASTSSPAPGW